MTNFTLWLLLAFFAGSLFSVVLLATVDWFIRRRHNLVTEQQVNAALARIQGGAS